MSAIRLWSELEAGGWKTLEEWCAHGERESVHLEAKTGRLESGNVRATDMEHLAKTLSAFANTDGGVLVFGVRTEGDVLVEPVAIESLARYAERLQAASRDITTPTIPGLRFRLIPQPNADDAGAVAVLVPLTDALPFRAEGPGATTTGRYYLRGRADSDPMPHQILAALFGRAPAPRIRLGFAHYPSDPDQIVLSVENAGRGTATSGLIRIARRVRKSDWWSEIIEANGPSYRWVSVPTADFELAFRLDHLERFYPLDRAVLCRVVNPWRPWTLDYRIDAEHTQPSLGSVEVPSRFEPFWVPGD
jgi:hypothetical protein